MIQAIGILEFILFYTGYFYKLFRQKKKGIITNQLGKGNKTKRTRVIEIILKISSILIILVIIVSVVCNTYFFSNPIVRYIGLVLIGLGTWLFIAAMITMKDSWRAGIPDQDKTEMVTRGIYKFSRNPAFLGFDLTYIGACLSFSNIFVLLITVYAIAILHLQILEEEKFLEATFRESYLEYKNKVGRYFLFL